jgi:glutathionyl-hydroquinone reductase
MRNSGTVRGEMEAGEFKRQEDAFRDWISDDAQTPYPAQGGRYHLYISLACPWASRALIARDWLGLQSVISISVVDPIRDAKGWAFREGSGHGLDPVNGFKFLSEAYAMSDAAFEGRVTVPVLWDRERRRIVNNSEDDICRMFNDAFRKFGNGRDLFPKEIDDEHRKLSDWIYENINNGVYRAGFATEQKAYERACKRLFAALDETEARLAKQRFLFGDRIAEADWRLFCTLIRFDAVYHGHFKCNVRRIVDYADLYQQPSIEETVNLDHIKRHYYVTHDDINPTRIVPIGPELDLEAAHGRERFGAVAF